MHGRATSANYEMWSKGFSCWPKGEVDTGAVELALPSAKRMGGAASSFFMGGPLSERVARFERETVLAELERNHHHVTNTAKALGLERSHLYKKCQQLGIDLRQVE